MLKIFTYFADWATALLGLELNTRLGAAVHFFLEDITKIFALIYVLIFIISLFRSQLSPQRVKQYLSGKKIWYGYILAVILGVITPFCSCSSIPLFIGFIAAGIPFGIAMAFLISSPLVSETSAILLLGITGAGPKVAAIYVIVGCVVATIGGWLSDVFHLERYVEYKPNTLIKTPNVTCCASKTQQSRELISYAHNYAVDLIKGIAVYIFIGIIIGAAIHGYVPADVISKYLGRDNFFSVPVAAAIGIPLYGSQGIIPIVQALLLKGVPVGTALVLLMSTAAISLPEMIMLRKVLKLKLIALFTLFLFISFIIVGYLLNWIV